MKGVKAVMDAIERKVDRMVNNAPQMLFRTLSVRDFWLDMFGTTQVRALVACVCDDKGVLEGSLVTGGPYH